MVSVSWAIAYDHDLTHGLARAWPGHGQVGRVQEPKRPWDPWVREDWDLVPAALAMVMAGPGHDQVMVMSHAWAITHDPWATNHKPWLIGQLINSSIHSFIHKSMIAMQTTWFTQPIVYFDKRTMCGHLFFVPSPKLKLRNCNCGMLGTFHDGLSQNSTCGI